MIFHTKFLDIIETFLTNSMLIRASFIFADDDWFFILKIEVI